MMSSTSKIVKEEKHPSILSTKILATNQKQLLLNARIGLVEYNAIKIEFVDHPWENRNFKNAVITSKNAAKAILKHKLSIENCFCVGSKTAAFLEENGFKIAESAEYGAALAKTIVENYSQSHFTFFCGNKRRDELPEILKENDVRLEEIEVYKTQLNIQQFQQEFDGILFFSPSAVKSFTAKNNIKQSVPFCIGNTTASEAKKHTENIVTATKPAIENVIVQVVKYFQHK